MKNDVVGAVSLNQKPILARALLAISTLLFYAYGSETAFGQQPAKTEVAIPEQYRPLYRTLQESLREGSQVYPLQQNLPKPVVCPNLCLAASVWNPWESEQQWQDVLATLEAFKGLGARGVLIQIVAPDLAYGDTERVIEFYRRLAAEVRARGMTVYVEHFVNTPFKANGSRVRGGKPVASRELKDDPEGRAEFLKVLDQ